MDTCITHASDSGTGQEVREPLSGIIGNSERTRREDSPAKDAMISSTCTSHAKKLIRKSDITEPMHSMWQGKCENESRPRSCSCTRTSGRLKGTHSD